MTIDHEMLDFAIRWRPWNGGSAEDIFVAFGLTETQYFLRLVRFIENAPSLNDVMRQELRDLCHRRLMLAKNSIVPRSQPAVRYSPRLSPPVPKNCQETSSC